MNRASPFGKHRDRDSIATNAPVFGCRYSRLVGPGGGSTITALGSTYTTKTDGEAAGGAYSLVEEELWGDPTPLHLHTREEEAFYVLSGRLAVWIDGMEQVAEPGAFLVVPRGVPHAARRVTDEPVRMLTLVSPSGLQRFFESVVREGEQELLAHPERLTALAAEFGSEILGDYPNTC
jgi:mannose-6-phosphate isomerase-like protein (cupin superfamily)